MSWRSLGAVLAVLALAGCSSPSDDAAPTSAAPTASSATGVATATTGVPRSSVAATSTPIATAPVTARPGTSQPVAARPAGTPVPTTPAPSGVAPVGFELVAGRVTAADGATCDVCLWLADTVAARAQGLMGVTDLSGADGMVFRWDEPTSGNFWMRDTPLPLSIAFFAADGTFVSAADMPPCLPPTPDAGCPRYDAAGPYQYAVEVALGGMAELLIAPGSRLELLAGGCATSP